MPQISIVTPTHNRVLVLHRAIESVLQQTFDDFEFHIVDDGSTDGTCDLVRRYNDSRIFYHQLQQRHGANYARNLGISLSRAEWVTFLDSDDAYLPDRLQRSIEKIKRWPGSNLWISSFKTWKRRQFVEDRNPAVKLSPAQLELLLMANGIKIAGSSITVRRQCLVECGGFDPTLGRMQDRDVLLRLSRTIGATLRHEIDWMKFPSADSLSRPLTGYIEALSALCKNHEDAVMRHRAWIEYHICRYCLRCFVKGHWLMAWKGLQEAKRSLKTNLRLLEMMRNYRTLKKLRRRIWHNILNTNRYDTASPPAPRPNCAHQAV